MERTGWRRAYYTVAVLAAVLVPLAATTAVWSVAASRRVLVQMEIGDEAAGVANLGPRGFVALAVVCWAVVAAAGRWRERAAATAVSAAALVAYVALCTAGVFDAWAPFLCITWRLT